MTPVTFTFPLEIEEFGTSGAGPDVRTVRGHAAVFDRLSHDLGGYRVKIAQGAFQNVLDSNPDVHLVIDHDTRYSLARTTSSKYPLELREDPYGLHMYARMAPTSFADDLAILMEGGVVNEMSFACDIGSDTWTEEGDEITRTINEVSALYDVTICAQGAFPQTDSQLVADLASAIEAGRVNRRAEGAAPAEEDTPESAALTPNEVREQHNLPAREEGAEEVAVTGASQIAASRIAQLRARARMANRI